MKQKAQLEASMLKQRGDLEANMLKQKGDYEASLHLLQCQKAIAAAEAEASAYEEVESGELSRIEDEPLDTVQRTTDYVHQQSKSIFSELPVKYRDGESLEQKTDKMGIANVESASPDTKHNTQSVYKDTKNERKTQSGPNEIRPRLYQSQPTFPEKRYSPEPQGAQDLRRYLIRKEMVSY